MLPLNIPRFKILLHVGLSHFLAKLTDICNVEYNWGEGLLGLFGMYVFD